MDNFSENRKLINRILPLLILSTILAAVGCVNNRKPPLLSVPPVDVSRLVNNTAFGERIIDGQNPGVSYQVDGDDVEVRAVLSGFVVSIADLGIEGCAHIQIQEFRNCQWQVSQGFVFNPTVNRGDRIVAGQILGTVGLDLSGNLTTDVSVLRLRRNEEVYYCPFDFATDEFIRQHDAISTVWCLEDDVVYP